MCVCVEVNTIILPIKERTEKGGGQLQIRGLVPCSSERRTHQDTQTHALESSETGFGRSLFALTLIKLSLTRNSTAGDRTRIKCRACSDELRSTAWALWSLSHSCEWHLLASCTPPPPPISTYYLIYHQRIPM